MKEFMYCFQIDKMTVFEAKFYTLSTNKTPYFSTSAARFICSKRDYDICGQCQERVLQKNSTARKFYDKWNKLNLHKLTEEEYAEIISDIEKLKLTYNYIENIRECFGRSARCYKTHIPFYEIVELSKLTPKKIKKDGIDFEIAI